MLTFISKLIGTAIIPKCKKCKSELAMTMHDELKCMNCADKTSSPIEVVKDKS